MRWYTSGTPHQSKDISSHPNHPAHIECEWKNLWNNEWSNERTNGQADEWMNKWMEERMNEQMNEWNGQIYGWRDGCG